MAQPTNTFDTYDSVGEREDLSDVIYNVSPTKTPFMTACEKIKASAVFHEWQIDSLAAAADDNAVIEGDDATTDAITATTRVGNYTQISDKVALVTGTQEVVKKAGRGSEMDYQMAKRMKEIKRDCEKQMLSNKASVAGGSSTARQSASVSSWITTNDSRGSGGSQGGFSAGIVAAPTDGTQRAFTETLLKAGLKLVADSGGDPQDIFLNSYLKQVMSGFTGGNNRDIDAGKKKGVAAVDIYVSDFGEHKVHLDLFQRTRDCLLLDMEYWGFATLRPFQTEVLAKTGDSVRKQLLVEYCLVAKNEASSGIIADLTDA